MTPEEMKIELVGLKSDLWEWKDLCYDLFAYIERHKGEMQELKERLEVMERTCR